MDNHAKLYKAKIQGRAHQDSCAADYSVYLNTVLITYIMKLCSITLLMESINY